MYSFPYLQESTEKKMIIFIHRKGDGQIEYRNQT